MDDTEYFGCLDLHVPHLIPLPVVLHLPGEAAGEDDPGHLEEGHHAEAAGDCGDTAGDEKVEAAGLHLVLSGLRTDSGVIKSWTAGLRRTGEVLKAVHSAAAEVGHDPVPEDGHAVLLSCNSWNLLSLDWQNIF